MTMRLMILVILSIKSPMQLLVIPYSQQLQLSKKLYLLESIVTNENCIPLSGVYEQPSGMPSTQENELTNAPPKCNKLSRKDIVAS
mmetsp:Transcript_15005/g.20916  ORF Transcript_15005/g.20916 Transcript_15005/m.20916 type:complete len:86 (+) Transcript_15005:35-292(+)